MKRSKDTQRPPMSDGKAYLLTLLVVGVLLGVPTVYFTLMRNSIPDRSCKAFTAAAPATVESGEDLSGRAETLRTLARDTLDAYAGTRYVDATQMVAAGAVIEHSTRLTTLIDLGADSDVVAQAAADLEDSREQLVDECKPML